ncbi:MAG: enoyl-CoA hydratase-related protein [Candidatus Thermoplasmatota archaeon]|nr:enoyl-CoA hydratase-related protein [Candidatus Thermoplasmatota archaeon]
MENVLIEKNGKIGIVTVNRPKQMNSMNSLTRSELAEAFNLLENDKDIAVILLTGSEGKAFIAGADIKEFLNQTIETEKQLEEDWIVTTIISNLKKPVIAVIDGFCLGGGLELAMSCDLRIASDRSKLGQPEINIGIIPGAGGTQRLTRLIGEGRAMEMILTGRMITAEEAFSYGIVNFVYDSDDLMDEAIQIANTIGDKSKYAVERAKKSVKAVSEMNLKDGLKLEREMFIECLNSEDGEEGITAFIEKRKPNFKGK